MPCRQFSTNLPPVLLLGAFFQKCSNDCFAGDEEVELLSYLMMKSTLKAERCKTRPTSACVISFSQLSRTMAVPHLRSFKHYFSSNFKRVQMSVVALVIFFLGCFFGSYQKILVPILGVSAFCGAFCKLREDELTKSRE